MRDVSSIFSGKLSTQLHQRFCIAGRRSLAEPRGPCFTRHAVFNTAHLNGSVEGSQRIAYTHCRDSGMRTDKAHRTLTRSTAADACMRYG
jgi:hypothetical protein